MGDRAAEAAKARAASQSLMQAKIKALRQAKQQQQQQDRLEVDLEPNTTNASDKPSTSLRVTNGRSGLNSNEVDSKNLTWFGVEDDEEAQGDSDGLDGAAVGQPIGHDAVKRASTSASSVTSSVWPRQSLDVEDDQTILGHGSVFPAPPPRGSIRNEDLSVNQPSFTICSAESSQQHIGSLQPEFSPQDSARASILLDDLERDLISARDAHSAPPPPSEHRASPSTSAIHSIASSSANPNLRHRNSGLSETSSANSVGPPSEPLPSLPTISTSKAQRIANQSSRTSRSSSPIGPPPAMGLPPLPSSPSSSSLASPVNGHFNTHHIGLDLRRTLRPGSSSSGSGRSSFESSPSGSSPGSSQIGGGRRSSTSRSPLASLPTGSEADFDSIDEDDDALESVLGLGEGEGGTYDSEMSRDSFSRESHPRHQRETASGPRDSMMSFSASSSSPSSSEVSSLRVSSPSLSSLSPYSQPNPGLGIGILRSQQELEDEMRRKSLMRKSMGSLMNALSDETNRWRRAETGPFGIESETDGNDTETEMGKHGHEHDDEDDRIRVSERKAEKQKDQESSVATFSYTYPSSSILSPGLNANASSQISAFSPEGPDSFTSHPTPIVTIDAADTSSGSDSDSGRDGPRKRRKAKKSKWAFDDQRAAPSRQGSIASMAPSRIASHKNPPGEPTSDPSDFNYYQFAPDLPPFVPRGMRPKDLTGAGTWQSIVAKAAATGSFTGPSTPVGSNREGATGHGLHRESAQSFQSTLSLQSTQSLQSNQSAGPVSMRKLAADARKRQAEQTQALQRQASQYSQLKFSPFELHAHASNATRMISGSRPQSSHSVSSAASSSLPSPFSPPGLSPDESAVFSQGLPAFNVSGHFPSALSGPYFGDSASEIGTMTARSSTLTLHGLGIDHPHTPTKVYAEMAQQTSPTSSPSGSPKIVHSEMGVGEEAPSAVGGEARVLSDGNDTEGEKPKGRRGTKTLTPTKRQPLRRRSTLGQTETALTRQRRSRLSMPIDDDDKEDLDPSSWTSIRAPRLSSRRSNIGTSPRGSKFGNGAFLLPPRVSDDLIGVNRSSGTSARSVSVYSTTSQDDRSSDDDDGSEESDLDVGTALEDLAEKSGMNFRGAKRKLKEKPMMSPSHAPVLGSRPISSLPSRSWIANSTAKPGPYPTPTAASSTRPPNQATGWSSSEGEDGDEENIGGGTATEVDESEAEQTLASTGSALSFRKRNGPSTPALLSMQTPGKNASKRQSLVPSSSSRSGSFRVNDNLKSNNTVVRKAASDANITTTSWRRSNRAERSRAESPELEFASQAGGSDDDEDDDWLSKDIDEKELSRYEDPEERGFSRANGTDSSPARAVPAELDEKVGDLNLADSSPAAALVSSPQETSAFPDVATELSSLSQLPTSISEQTDRASKEGIENDTTSRDAVSNALQDSVDSAEQPNSVDLDGTPYTLGSSWSRADGSDRNSAATSATSSWSEDSGGGKNQTSDSNHSSGKFSGDSNKGSTSQVKSHSTTEGDDNKLKSGAESNSQGRTIPPADISSSLNTPSKPMISRLPSPAPRSSLPTPSSSISRVPRSSSPVAGRKEDPRSVAVSTPPPKSIPLPSTPSASYQTASKLKSRASMSSGLRPPQASKSRPSLPPSSRSSSKSSIPATISGPTTSIPASLGSSPSIRRMKSFGDKGSSSFVPPPNSTLPRLDSANSAASSTTARRSSANVHPISGRSSPSTLIPTSSNLPPSSWSANRPLNRKSSVSSLSGSNLPKPSGLPTPKKV